MDWLSGRRPLIVAGALAALAGLLAYFGFSEHEKQALAGWETTKVVVAAKNIEAGTPLTEENIKVSDIPERFFTKSVIRPEDVGPGRVLGQKAAVPMAEGDPLLWTHIATSTGTTRLAQTITSKGRAVAIRVSPESSVQNWIRPFDHVDVLSTLRDAQTGDHVTLTLLENVVVLATGVFTGATLTQQNDRSYSTVTLQVMPEAAEMLVLAQEMGSLYLTLHNPDDGEMQETRASTGTSLKTITAGERTHLVSQKQSKTFQGVEVIRGGHSSEQHRFPGGK